MNVCPCCSGQLLRHARHSGVYLFCPHCWQEMPDLAAMIRTRPQHLQRLEVQRRELFVEISSAPSRQKALQIA